MTATEPVVRPATEAEAGRLAELHASRITEGFLPTLGPGFLRRLYRRIVRADTGFALVAVADGEVVGFVAGTDDVGRLYREFILHDGVAAGLAAAPRLVRSWRRMYETLRYPAQGGDDLPAAEILAVAVADRAARRGFGRSLVGAALGEFGRRGVPAAKVVAGADNTAAVALYEACGFTRRARVAVHAGTASEVLVWSSS